MPGVRQDDAAEVDGRLSGVDGPAEAFFHESGNPAAVIEMGMGEDDGVDGVGGNGCVLPVALAPFFWSLEHAAVDQDLKAGGTVILGADEMFGAGDGACRAEKLDVGQTIPPGSVVKGL